MTGDMPGAPSTEPNAVGVFNSIEHLILLSNKSASLLLFLKQGGPHLLKEKVIIECSDGLIKLINSLFHFEKK